MPSPTEFELTDAQATLLIEEGNAIVDRLKALATEMELEVEPTVMTALQHAVARGLLEITGPGADVAIYVNGTALFAQNLLVLTMHLAQSDSLKSEGAANVP